MQEKNKKLIYLLSYYFVLGLLPVLVAWMLMGTSGGSVRTAAILFGMIFAFVFFIFLACCRKISLIMNYVAFFMLYGGFFYIVSLSFAEPFDFHEFLISAGGFSIAVGFVWLFMYFFYLLGRSICQLFSKKDNK